ncbi:hypothetical protein ETH_00009540 [Eimeria tenella]|uniref:AP2/ERF domain-containing protein n=1 Tax=Eimeria tenella TaxID=5802 RepID=U6KJL8_EIMTE|nr:hypothetical protein ETH_00009540 [Eimeria tenella]CDJ38225.1 hypothetical protein ETH_00009540 [Eimeria tenella]|eukprot:XP_013229063.1 hypothetical protein ETH_00009540 [Eimeria tenella]
MAARLLSFSKPSAEEDVFLWGRAERYERLRLQQVQQMHHTPGIHFDKHSLRWKATWYDISGHRKAKYFPIARYGFDRARLLAIHTRLTNHIPRGSRCKESAASEDNAFQVLPQPVPVPQSELKSPRSTAASLPAQDPNAPGALQLEKADQNKSNPSCFPEQCDYRSKPTSAVGASEISIESDQPNTLSAITDGGYDEERDRRLSKAPSRVLIRHASRLTRVPGIWFDKKQLRWACTFTDVQSGKRRAEYFPIRHFGFLGARLLAVNARKRMERARSQACGSAFATDKLRKENIEAREPAHDTSDAIREAGSLNHRLTRDSDTPDLWNSYVLETLQQRGYAKEFSSSSGVEALPVLLPGCVDVGNHASNGTPLEEDSKCTSITAQREDEKIVVARANSESILSMGRAAIRFLLCDLRTHCLNALGPEFSAEDSTLHMTMLQRHALWIEKAQHCQSLEKYLIIFAGCIKRMKLPSHLCEGEQRRLLKSIAALRNATRPLSEMLCNEALADRLTAI